MNRFKGISATKPPAFLVDLYADLRDRRLLPLVAVLIVGIVAAPILLKDKSEPSAPPIAQAPAAAANTASFSVVPAQPGLRDYRKRLGRRQPQDPFQSQVTTAPSAAQEESSESESQASGGKSEVVVESTETTQTTESSSGSETQSQAPGGADSGGTSPTMPVIAHNYLFTYAVDLRAGVTGHVSERPAVRGLTRLPSPRNPVVVFMGFSKKETPLFLITSRVTSYSGKVGCAVDKANCQLLEIPPGRPVDFVFGAANSHFRLTVQRLVLIVKPEHGKRRVIRH
jgi:hypothetical protein